MSSFILGESLASTLKNWIVQLRGLTFHENFKSYEWEGEIQPGQEKGIPHGLRLIPTRWIMLRAKGTCLIIEGDTRHTRDHFYIKNISTTSIFTGKILVLP